MGLGEEVEREVEVGGKENLSKEGEREGNWQETSTRKPANRYREVATELRVATTFTSLERIRNSWQGRCEQLRKSPCLLGGFLIAIYAESRAGDPENSSVKEVRKDGGRGWSKKLVGYNWAKNLDGFWSKNALSIED